MPERTWDQYEKYLIQRWPLTRREVRIAVECMKGKKNREIASTLGIGTETVNKHLDHVYRITGLNGRDQLAAELLIADIDNTPLQQYLSLAGQGASAVGAGFIDTLYASRAERRKGPSRYAGPLKARRGRGPSEPAKPYTTKEPITVSARASGVGDVSPVLQRWLAPENTATVIEDGRMAVAELALTKASES